MTRYGKHETVTEVDSDWATLDVTVHWTLDRDDYGDLLYIDKITVGNKDLYEGWNYDYFEALIQAELESCE